MSSRKVRVSRSQLSRTRGKPRNGETNYAVIQQRRYRQVSTVPQFDAKHYQNMLPFLEFNGLLNPPSVPGLVFSSHVITNDIPGFYDAFPYLSLDSASSNFYTAISVFSLLSEFLTNTNQFPTPDPSSYFVISISNDSSLSWIERAFEVANGSGYTSYSVFANSDSLSTSIELVSTASTIMTSNYLFTTKTSSGASATTYVYRGTRFAPIPAINTYTYYWDVINPVVTVSYFHSA